MTKYNRLPLKFLGITGSWEEHVSRGSRGQDFGWNSKYGGQNNTSVYATNDGKVMYIDKSTGSNNAGYYIWIKHEYSDHDEWSRYCHLKENSAKVKVGDKVTRGQQIAIMGGTYGYATHLHFEIWRVPKNWKFNFSDRSKYSVRSTDLAYAFEDQVISSDDTKLITKIVGTSKIVKRDTSKNQIEVIGYQLRCRKDAGTDRSVLGYIDYGIYDYTETKSANGYTWYHVPSGWIAGVKGDVNVYSKVTAKPTDNSANNSEPVAEPITDDKDKQIEELTKQVNDLTTQLNTQKSLNGALSQQNEELLKKVNKNVKKMKFICKKTGKYYKKLKTGETLYIKT